MHFFKQLIDAITQITQTISLALVLNLAQSSTATPTPTPTSNVASQSATLATPKVSPSPKLPPQLASPKTQTENYQLEPDPDGKEGFFIIKSAPSETMSTVESLNSAVNNYRQTHNLNQLYIDPQLCEIAYQRAVEIDQEFSHEQFAQHVEAGDYNYTGFNSIGENLWQGSFTGVHIVEFGWDKSPGHRDNLQGDWSRGCAGIFKINATFIFAR